MYEVAAQKVRRRDSSLRSYPDSAYLYYMLIRVSIENDEMMQNGPERDLNKLFKRLVSLILAKFAVFLLRIHSYYHSQKEEQSTDQEHVRTLFNLQQKILDGLEYLEENRRELPIWGIPPFGDHQVHFHQDHSPSCELEKLICDEMDLVEKSFDQILGHWHSLKSQVDRYLDLLIQFRVLDQQQLALRQSDMAVKQQALAVQEAKTARAQAQSVSVFTFITVLFLPLTFFTSYFGIHLTDVDNKGLNSTYFWAVSAPISIGLITIIIIAVQWAGVRGDDIDLESAQMNPPSVFKGRFQKLFDLVLGHTKEKEV